MSDSGRLPIPPDQEEKTEKLNCSTTEELQESPEPLMSAKSDDEEILIFDLKLKDRNEFTDLLQADHGTIVTERLTERAEEYEGDYFVDSDDSDDEDEPRMKLRKLELKVDKFSAYVNKKLDLFNKELDTLIGVIKSGNEVEKEK